MTEAQWLACSDPAPMLAYLRGKASDRKLRLFAVACCRQGGLASEEGQRIAVEVAERFADGRATPAERASAEASLTAGAAVADPRSSDLRVRAAGHTALAVAQAVGGHAALPAAKAVCGYAALAVAQLTPWDFDGTLRGQADKQAALLQDIFGNPFRSLSLSPAWLAWSGGIVPKLAQAIYDDRAFDRLPVLADALEDAGCADPDLLAHLRGPGPHVRGCWAVDLMLGRE